MTMEREAVDADLFGLAGTFPRPGWVVLDAAREHRFTGRIVFDTFPEVHIYLDRGRIYLAERITDPSLGSRLVDAGALNAAQLEHGAMRVAGGEHLGRLFERVPSVDRHAVLVMAELMTEECVGWLATQNVHSAESTPYLHHPSGVHSWDRPSGWYDLAPGDPLPAPAPDQAPVEVSSPEPLFGTDTDSFDPMIEWDEPSWLDDRIADSTASAHVVVPPPSTPPAAAPAQPTGEPAPAEHEPTEPTTEPTAEAPPSQPVTPPEATAATEPEARAEDWIDRLETDGLPEVGSDPLGAATRLPPIPVAPADRFEVIWPTGEVDEQFGAVESAVPDHPDLDRPGLTARIGTETAVPAEPEPEPATPIAAPSIDLDALTVGGPEAGDEDDDVVLAVRRAVASIETGTLAPRRRLADDTPPESESPAVEDAEPESPTDPWSATSPDGDLVLPARVAARSEHSVWTQGGSSVFDEVPPSATPILPADEPEPASDEQGDEPERTSALRRLIGSLRRR